MASPHDLTKLVSDLARLLSRELLLSVPAEEFSALTEAEDALARVAQVLEDDTPELVRDFLIQFSKFAKIEG